MTLYWYGSELNFDELRLTIYQRSREFQCEIVQEVLESILPIFTTQGLHFPEMLECFVLAIQRHYSDTTGWQIFHSAMEQVCDRPSPKEDTVKVFDDFLRACRAEGYHLIEVMEGFSFATSRKCRPCGEIQEKSLHLLNEACEKLIHLRELETDEKYNRTATVTNLHATKESSQPELRSA